MSRKFSLKGRVLAAAALLAGAVGLTGAPAAQAQETYQTFDSTVGIYNCSASLIQLPGARDSDRALVLTNGHCIEPVFDRYLDRGEVITNHTLFWLFNKGYFKEISFYGGETPTVLAKGKLTDIVYSTMDDTDIAILKTDKTYAQLKASGVKIRPFSTERPQQGTQIQIPSTYWNKAYSCQIDGFAHELHESPWVWKDAIRYTAEGCRVQSGSSGSPIVDAQSGAIIGVNNTYVGGGDECGLGNACEVSPDGSIRTMSGRGYGTQTYTIPTCFNGSSLAMNKPGCLLPKK
ncbi:MAG: serine protease [Rothia sp. (in: high G+C Gram-positive bacteria)]|nr:serine protease [Rothia sp. (in: high G+C Gram-positive bacteria)]